MNTCDYCHAIGACPKCWGRAGIDELKAENARLREAIERLLPAAENWACHQEVYYYPEGKSSASAAIRMARAALTGEA